MSKTRTQAAFNRFRSVVKTPRTPPPNLIDNPDQEKQMTVADGLMQWKDGIGKASQPSAPPRLDDKDVRQKTHLWAVLQEDVAYAPEHCSFGDRLQSRVIKHTNLTGGQPAFSGGELFFLDENTIVVNGKSGRYGVRSANEMDEVAKAFSASGYGVWSMGFDEETKRPFPFVGISPEWIK